MKADIFSIAPELFFVSSISPPSVIYVLPPHFVRRPVVGALMIMLRMIAPPATQLMRDYIIFQGQMSDKDAVNVANGTFFPLDTPPHLY